MIQVVMVACTCIVIGLVVNGLSIFMGTNFIVTFLDANLLVLLIALWAINTTTVSVILTKMREIKEKYPSNNFVMTRNSMKWATIEQLILVVVAVVVQMCKTSVIVVSFVPHGQYIFNSLLVGVFAFSLQILFDTARGVYVILDHEL